jgi:hypothetical protein
MDLQEVDNLVAKKLFGWKDQDGQLMPPSFFVPRGSTPARMLPPKYSSDPKEAQKVWEKMVEYGGDKYDKFLAALPSLVAQRVETNRKIRYPGELVPPLEICQAALKALGA